MKNRPTAAPGRFRFGDFELDAATGELRRNGQPLHLERLPVDLLIVLVEHAQQLVSREQIVTSLWGERAFVDVETGINTAVRKIRQVLSDSADTPRFIETIPGRGYRFALPVRREQDSYPPASRMRIAVLPFTYLGDGEQREYLADGMTEETIAALAQIDAQRLSVVARTSVMRYKRAELPLRQIGQELGADYLLESSIRGEANRLRVTSRLIDAADETVILSSSSEHEPVSLLTFQKELAIVIAEQIRLRISPERLALITRRQTQDAEAYDLYLRGRHLWYQLTPLATRQAIEHFQRAIARDENYALALSGLADAYSASPINGDAPPIAAWRRAQDCARRAVASGADLAETHATLAFVDFWFTWDWVASEESYRKSISIDPNYAFAHRMLGVVLSHMGRHAEARDSIRRARELDPYAMHHALSAMVELHARDYPAAVEFARQAIVIAPEFWIGHYQLAQAYERLGQYELALESLDTSGQLVGGNSKIMGVRGYVLARSGKIAAAREVLAALKRMSCERYFPPYAMALVSAALEEERDTAIECLEAGYDARDVHLIFLPVDPKWDDFQTDARFRQLLRKCGFASNLPSPRSTPRFLEPKP